MEDQTYTVGAFMDLSGDMGPPAPGEPFAWYDPGGDGAPNEITVSGGAEVNDIDITLHDPALRLLLPMILRMHGVQPS